MANFFSPEAEMALMVQDESMGHLFPSSSCQSPPGIMYPSPLQHMPRGPAISQAGSGHLYAQSNDYRMVNSAYQPQQFWTSAPSQIPQTQVSYSTSTYPPFTGITAGQTLAPDPFPLPPMNRPARSPSGSSLGVPSNPPSERSPPSLTRSPRSLSPSSPDLRAYGFPNKDGTWSCNYPGCTSRAVFTRGCDLRKHHKRHTKSFFCRHEGCPQATGGGFSSKKDLARHEAKHNPGVLCDWEGCDRVFSRVDNMRDHVKRIHLKKSRTKSGSSS